LNPFRPLGPAFRLRPEPAGIARANKQGLDVDAIHAACSGLRGGAASLSGVAALQLFLVFGCLPLATLFLRPGTALLACAPVAFSLSVAAAVLYNGVAAQSALSRLDRYGNLVKLLLYPVSVIRSVDLLSFDLLAGYDPIAAVAALAGKEPAAALLEKETIALRYRVRPSGEEERAKARLALLEQFAKKHQLPTLGCAEAPAPADPQCRTYCPNCGTQYRLPSGFCADCADILLQPLAAR
jgi:hypothetical protein